jgi:hypothetical protein
MCHLLSGCSIPSLFWRRHHKLFDNGLYWCEKRLVGFHLRGDWVRYCERRSYDLWYCLCGRFQLATALPLSIVDQEVCRPWLAKSHRLQLQRRLGSGSGRLLPILWIRNIKFWFRSVACLRLYWGNNTRVDWLRYRYGFFLPGYGDLVWFGYTKFEDLKIFGRLPNFDVVNYANWAKG